MNPNQGPDGPNYPGNQGFPPPPPPGYPQPGQGNQGQGNQGQGYPPQGPGYPGPGYPGPGYPGPGYPRPANQGFMGVVQDLYQRWQAVIQGHSVPAFDAQLPSANWQPIWIGLVILGIVRGIVGAIGTVISNAAISTITIGGQRIAARGDVSPIGSLVTGFIFTFIGFAIGAGILHLIARAFSGSGTFLSYAYLLSLIFVPLGIVSSVIGLIPVLGALAALVIGIFEIYLAILATASAHRLPMDRATWVVLIPVIAGFVLALLLFALAAAVLVGLGLHM